MNPFKITFVGLGLMYLIIFGWGLAGHLPNIPTLGIFGMLWCALGWSIVHRLDINT